MQRHLFALLRYVGFAAILLASPVSAAPYAPHDLGTLGGNSSIALAINGAGVVVGHSSLSPSGSNSHATVWYNGRITDLGTLGGGSSFAEGVSNNGLVAGYSFTADQGGLNHHAFLWDHGTMKDLGTLGTGSFSTAFSVNNAGQVVGDSAFKSGSYDIHAFLWQGGTMTDLAPTSARSSAHDINGLGQIVGYSSPAGHPGMAHATLWQGSQVIDLGASFTGKSFANAISENGQVVGYVDNGVTQRAVTWINGQMKVLPVWSGGGNTIAYDVNNYGQIVGSALTAAGVAHAVLWQDGRIIDLGTLGGRSSVAMAINGTGVIVGSATFNAGSTFPSHATLWSK